MNITTVAFAGVMLVFDALASNREAYRKRLHKMTDLELLQYSKAARDLVESELGESRELYIIRLEECQEEWKRRHPSPASIE